jgi:hypothetical protein
MSSILQATDSIAAGFGRSPRPLLEQITLRLAHPRSIFVRLSALPWMIYFCWRGDLFIFFGIYFIALAVSLVMTYTSTVEQIARTTIGKIALLHMHPINIALQVFGVISFFFGVFEHTTEAMLFGFTLISLGHFFGWSRVDARFSVEEDRALGP